MDYEIVIPESLRAAFGRGDHAVQHVIPQIASRGDEQKRFARPMERAEYMWRIANGSLLLPVLLALAVLYYVGTEMSSLRNIQMEALKPILDQQMELLKEDRERIKELQASPVQSQKGQADSPQTFGP
jgi:hypothetical protein